MRRRYLWSIEMRTVSRRRPCRLAEPGYAIWLIRNWALMQLPLIEFDERVPVSGQILSVWRSRSEKAGSFKSTAYPNWEFVFSYVDGTATAVLRGPETIATNAEVPANGSWLGIRFKSGALLRGVNYGALRDRKIDLEMVGHTHFRLGSTTYEVPTFHNAECLVERLVRSKILEVDPQVVSTMQNDDAMSTNIRTLQRRFVSATGLSRQTIKTIERARSAAAMIRAGCTISDTIAAAGYCDQSQLTRSLTRFIGTTPAGLRRDANRPQLSFFVVAP